MSDLRDRVLHMMEHRGWSLHWEARSAHLHLEASELTEAVRGKRGDPAEEAADVLITLLALSPIGLDEMVERAGEKVEKWMTKPPYKGESTITGDVE